MKLRQLFELISLAGNFTGAGDPLAGLGFIFTTLGDDSKHFTNGVPTDNGASGAMVRALAVTSQDPFQENCA